MFAVKEYRHPEKLSDVLELMREDPSLVPVAGGTDIFVKMRKHPEAAYKLIGIAHLAELKEISVLSNGAICIGSGCTFTQIFEDDIINREIPILAQAAISMGGPQIRNVATIGGNLCNGAVSADSAPALFALEAELELVKSDGRRQIPINEFYIGPGQVDLQPGELLKTIIIPKRPLGEKGCYLKYSMREAMDIATLSLAALLTADGQTITQLRLASGVMNRVPVRLIKAEQAGEGQLLTGDILDRIAETSVEDTKARDSWRASRKFREHMLKVLCKKAMATLLED